MAKVILTPPSIRRITEGPRSLQIIWDDGHSSRYHYIWLRDNSPQSRDANGQRLHDIHDIPEGIHPWSVELSEEGGLKILWAHGEHRSHYSLAWLRANCYSTHFQTLHSLNDSEPRPIKPELWSGKVVDKPMLTRVLEEVVMNPTRRRDWIESLKRYGVGILRGVGTGSGDINLAVRQFGIIRETHLGRILDVNPVSRDGKNTDNKRTRSVVNEMNYRNPMPKLQVFHCLSAADKGAKCSLVDGYLVSGLLRRKQPGMFLLLSSYPAPFLWVDSQHCFFIGRTVIDTNYRGEPTNMHFNHPSAGPFHVPSEIMESYYKGYRTFANMLNDPSYQFQFTLEPGEVVVFDNSRVLHDRQSFFYQGGLHVQGCYASLHDI